MALILVWEKLFTYQYSKLHFNSRFNSKVDRIATIFIFFVLFYFLICIKCTSLIDIFKEISVFLLRSILNVCFLEFSICINLGIIIRFEPLCRILECMKSIKRQGIEWFALYCLYFEISMAFMQYLHKGIFHDVKIKWTLILETKNLILLTSSVN